MHLTNYSVNKKSDKFVPDSGAGGDDEASGSKWSLRALAAHLTARAAAGEGPGWEHVWRQVRYRCGGGGELRGSGGSSMATPCTAQLRSFRSWPLH